MPKDRAQVHVFLSSSMATPQHVLLRKRLRRALKRDRLLDVFTIEARASGDTSDDIMLRKIDSWADVVLVILQHDLRPGVDREVNLAMRFGRRVILLTHTGEKSAELAGFVEALKRDGRPFQCEYSDSRELVRLARSSVLHDIVDAYRESQRELFLLRKHVSGIIPESTKACHRFLRELFLGEGDVKKPTEGGPEVLATNRLMQAIVDGGVSEAEIALGPIRKELPPQYREVISLRWQAIRAAAAGDFPEALTRLKAARAEADKERLPLWVKRDIVVDLQYIEIDRANQGHDDARQSVGSFQQQLASLSGWEYRSPVYYDLYALGHRFLSETVKARLTGERTVVFGSNLPIHLDELSEALVAGVWLGSYNILRLVRSMLSEVLLHYGFTYEDGDLLRAAVRLLVVECENRRLEDFLKLHAALIPDRARSELLSVAASGAVETKSPETWIACSLLYEYLADWVRDEDLEGVRRFLQECHNFDVDRGFRGNVMRQAMAALPRFGHRFPVTWIDRLASPLLTGHPVLASEAMDALRSVGLKDLDTERLKQIADQVLGHRGSVLLHSALGLLLAVAEANEELRADIAVSMAREWREKKSALAAAYFANSGAGTDTELLTSIATEVTRAIDKANDALAPDTPIELQGVSRWRLLAALINRGAVIVNESVVGLAEAVLLNPQQTSSEKKDCLEALLWLEHTGKLAGSDVLPSVAATLSAQESEVLTARGLGSQLSASAQELRLYTAALIALGSGGDSAMLLRRAAAVVQDRRLDARLAAVAALRHLLPHMGREQLGGALLLLRVFVGDAHFEVRCLASHGVSEALHRMEERDVLAEELSRELLRDPHPLVREGALHIAASWGNLGWVSDLLVAGREDASYRVRSTAEAKLRDVQASPSPAVGRSPAS